MRIQWFPGHMHKAGKEIKAALPDIDVLIEVLDARIPFSSQNPMLARLRQDKPTIRVLAKSDLADPELTHRWQASMEREQGVKTLAVSTRQPDKIRRIQPMCAAMAARRQASGRVIRCMIMGIPNVGKSTLINILAGRAIAKTGDEPAVTKMQQKINLGDDIILSDTPGILWPNLENRNSGYRLAVTGAIRDTAFEYDDIALFALDYLLLAYRPLLQQRYRLTNPPADAGAALTEIAARRGCLRAGGEPDLPRAAKLFLTELRAGRLGPLTLETPEMAAAEQMELEQQRAARAGGENVFLHQQV